MPSPDGASSSGTGWMPLLGLSPASGGAGRVSGGLRDSVDAGALSRASRGALCGSGASSPDQADPRREFCGGGGGSFRGEMRGIRTCVKDVVRRSQTVSE